MAENNEKTMNTRPGRFTYKDGELEVKAAGEGPLLMEDDEDDTPSEDAPPAQQPAAKKPGLISRLIKKGR